MFLLFVRK